MANAILGMVADLGAPIPQTVFATDAMGQHDLDFGGFGIVAARCSTADVEQAFCEGLDPGFAVCKLSGDLRGLKRPDRRIGRTIPFSRLPEGLFEAEYTPLDWGRWSQADHITLGEARAVVRMMEIACRDPRSHRHRVLSLQDNRPVCGSFAKGRSTAPALNRLCRQRASFGLATELQVLLPWTEPKKMPADGLSRLQGSSAGIEKYETVIAPSEHHQFSEPQG